MSHPFVVPVILVRSGTRVHALSGAPGNFDMAIELTNTVDFEQHRYDLHDPTHTRMAFNKYRPVNIVPLPYYFLPSFLMIFLITLFLEFTLA